MNIGARTIDESRIYVIAEIGGNHDGHLAQAQALIEQAAVAGADAAKFQLFKPDRLYPGSHTEGSISAGWMQTLKRTCEDFAVEFLCSVFCLDTLAAYVDTDPAAVKIASPEATDLALLTQAALTGVPLLVSTGAMGWPALDRSMRVLDGHDVALLHCVSAYPAPVRQMNLAVIPMMRKLYGVPVGLSDHTLHPWRAPLSAFGLGASIVEKHLTLDRSLKGPDHSYALTPGSFASMVRELRIAGHMHGDGVKRVQPSEDATDRRAA